MRRSLRARASIATLISSLVLSGAGAIALVVAPEFAGAGVTPGVKPDFALSAGDTVRKDFSKPLVGSVEVKGTPDECRNDPASGLTCAAHRIKLNRSGATRDHSLKIFLEWDAAAGDILAVPDIDMYLFDEPTAQFNSTVVGGAGSTMPEKIQIVPAADEYDVVVQAYAGAIAGYTITAAYTDSGGLPLTKQKADIELSPREAPFLREYSSALVGANDGVLVKLNRAFAPEECRTDPSRDALCDVYRIKLNRTKAKDALNFVVLTLDWKPVVVPGLVVAVAGVPSAPLPDLDVFVYDSPDSHLEGIGGDSIDGVPERIGWTATQDEYDLVVQSAQGAGTGYKIGAYMTDELFDSPFELLDPITGQPLTQAPDGTIVPIDSSGDGSPVVPPLALAPIGVDGDIAGIGLGTTERFDAAEAVRLGRAALRNTSATTRSPSSLILLLTLVVAPALLLGASVAVLRRRRSVLF